MASPFIDPAARHPYVLKEHRELPKEQQWTFYFRVLSVKEWGLYAECALWEPDPAKPSEVRQKNFVSHRVELLRFSLVGWDGPGAPEFKKDARGNASDDALSRIDGDCAWELAQFASDLNRSEERRVGKECRSRWSTYH